MGKGAGIRALAVALAALGMTASAATAEPLIGTLFGAGGGSIRWVKAADAPGDSDGYALALAVPSAGSYAGFNYTSPPATAPGTAPSFEFSSTLSGAAGGSPRLVIAFANGDYIYAAPTAWTAGAWSAVGGSASDWYDAGLGGCAAQSEVTYAQALACSHGSSVSNAYLVADNPSTATLYVDDVRFDGLLSSEPGNVLGVKVSRTGFLHTIRVNHRTGIGGTGATCSRSHASCRFEMKLTLRHAGHTVTVGRLRGTVAAQSGHRLRVRLNRTGRRLLAHAHRLHVMATGRWPTTGRIRHLRLTLKT